MSNCIFILNKLLFQFLGNWVQSCALVVIRYGAIGKRRALAAARLCPSSLILLLTAFSHFSFTELDIVGLEIGYRLKEGVRVDLVDGRRDSTIGARFDDRVKRDWHSIDFCVCTRHE